MTIVARTGKRRRAAEEIGARDRRRVACVACDITTPEGRAAALAACPEPDILVNNAGGPPPGDFREFDRDAWIRAIDANMLTPIELIKATVDKMVERKFGRIVNITSSAVKAPIDILGLSNGARSGLTGFVAGHRAQARARTTSRSTTCCRATSTRTACSTTMEGAREGRGQGRGDDAWKPARAAIPARRFGNAEEFGAVCAFICSVQAGYSSGRTSCSTAARTRHVLTLLR